VPQRPSPGSSYDAFFIVTAMGGIRANSTVKLTLAFRGA
jgi:hypothetical protein